MIIGVDVREGIRKQRAGKGEYVYQLVDQLLKHPDHKFVLFADGPLPSHWSGANVRSVQFSRSPFLWQLAVFLHLEFTRSVDVYFSTTSLIVPSLVRSVPTVTVLFDFVSFLFPRGHKAKAVLWEKLFMAPAIRYSRMLVAISEHTKRDAIKLFRAHPRKIIVTPLAPSFVAKQVDINLPGCNVILFVGTLEPRKNLNLLITAFNRLRDDSLDTHLVLAGQWGWQSEAIKRAIDTSAHKDRIHVMGFILDNQKASLYRKSTVFAFPSLYEGFGLPPLEAMTMGVPVIVSRVSSLPEVVGQAGLLIDPNSIDSLYTALKNLLTDPNLRHRLSQAGRDRAQEFSWEKTVAMTLQAIEQTAR